MEPPPQKKHKPIVPSSISKIEGAAVGDNEIFDRNSLKALLMNLQKAITRNLYLRQKFAGEPPKFMESEMELHSELKKLQNFTSSPELYGDFLQLDGLSILFSLLTHENKDILMEEEEEEEVVPSIIIIM